MNKLLQSTINAAVAAARESGCKKSQRGAVAFDIHSLAIVGSGANTPPAGWCTGSERCREVCPKLCIHAEMNALRRVRSPYREVDIVHAKIVDDELVAGGGPSCWQCARDMRHDDRVRGVWLFHEEGWRRYTISEFYALTMTACGMDER